jgi:hypothetical protein
VKKTLSLLKNRDTCSAKAASCVGGYNENFSTGRRGVELSKGLAGWRGKSVCYVTRTEEMGREEWGRHLVKKLPDILVRENCVGATFTDENDHWARDMQVSVGEAAEEAQRVLQRGPWRLEAIERNLLLNQKNTKREKSNKIQC